MKISVPRETHPGETRAPLTPDSVGKLVKLGAQVEVEAGLGITAGFSDEAFQKAGAIITADRQQLIGSGDIVLRLRKPRHSQCHFLGEDGCAIHPAKPTQCRVFPFWPELVGSPAAWRARGSTVPASARAAW